MLRQPALWAVLLAVAFLAAWAGWAVYERAMGFPGDDNVRQVVNLALRARLGSLEPLDTECGTLGDTLFLRHNVTDYDVPEAFTHEMASGYRVFKKDEDYVTQVQTRGDGLVFLVFRADGAGRENLAQGHLETSRRRRLDRRGDGVSAPLFRGGHPRRPRRRSTHALRVARN